MGDLRQVLPYFVGYVVFYAPFCYLSSATHLPPLQLLPASTAACVLAMLGTLWVTGWWRQIAWSAPRDCGVIAERNPRTRVSPAVWSGCFTALVLLSVPLAYALPVPVLASGLVMKGSVLCVAPVADLWNRVPVSRHALAALGMCLGGLLLALGGLPGQVPALGWVVYVAYVLGYLGRFRAMRGQTKNLSFFATEHLVTSCAALAALVLATPFSSDLRAGWALLGRGDLWMVGFLSNAAGLTGGWLLLTRRECSWTVPLNRAGAVIAAVVVVFWAGGVPTTGQWLGLGAVLGAVWTLR